jgi:hypothetical protein
MTAVAVTSLVMENHAYTVWSCQLERGSAISLV